MFFDIHPTMIKKAISEFGKSSLLFELLICNLNSICSDMISGRSSSIVGRDRSSSIVGRAICKMIEVI